MTGLAQRRQSQLLVVDVQERLLPAMHDANEIASACIKLAKTAQRLGVPITISEQYPKGIGATIQPLIEACGSDAVVLPKMTFSCLRNDMLAPLIESHANKGRRQIILCGIESHVCVLQTAFDLKARGYDVLLATDATGSRAPHSKTTALSRMQQAGVALVTFEMIAFEWLECAGTDEFRAIMPVIK